MSERNVPEVRFKGFCGEWVRYELGDIGNTYTGLSGKTKNDFGHGSGKYVTYMNVFSNAVANLYDVETIEVDATQNVIKMGDVFFTTSSETPEEVGMSSIWLEDTNNVYLNSFCFGYRPEKIFDYCYLAYMLRSPSVRKKITFLAQGISRYNISKNKAMNISVPVPKTQEQAKIGEFFKNLDNLIAQNQKKYDKLVNMKKASLNRMFPKDGADTPEVRFKGFSEKWEKVVISNLGNVVTGTTPPTSDKSNYGNEYLFVSPADIKENRYVQETITKLSKIGFSRNRRLKSGSILFVSIGSTIGKVAQINIEASTNQQLNTIEPYENYYNDFVFSLILSIAKNIKHSASAQAVPIINKTSFSNFEVYVATSYNEQTKIGTFFQTLDHLITLRKTELEKLKNIKKACLDKMFI